MIGAANDDVPFIFVICDFFYFFVLLYVFFITFVN